MIPTEIWSVKDRETFKEFIVISETTSFKKGIGLPGRVLENESLVFIPDAEFDSNFPRLKSLNDIPVRGAFGIPIKVHGEIRAVLEFFSEKKEVPNTEIMELVDRARAQICLAFEKWEYEMALLKEKNKAEQANKAKSDFLANMSHELRTPLNAIVGFAQLLKLNPKTSLTSLEKENVETILSAGNHLLTLINEILDLSSIESGNLFLTMETIDIVPIVDNVISVSQTLAAQENISLKYHQVPNESCFVDLDALKFKQIVFNLVSNAIKYNNPNGSVVIYLEKGPSDLIRIGVKDSGRGIPEDKVDKLFQPFERFETDKKVIEGTGIGLTISKKLTEMMNGNIGYERLADGGSLFFVDFPLSKKVPEFHAPKPMVKVEGSGIPKESSLQILYIEDIPANFELVRQVLSQRPEMELAWASNAENGIQIAKEIIPDLILMDIHLPGMDGLAAFKILQSINETKHIPVIALTADAMDRDIKKANDIGFKDYITKPIDIPIFLEKIERVLEGI